MTNRLYLATSCISLLFLSACRAEWEPEASSLSPDRNILAIAEYKGSAACCSDHSRLRLLEQVPGTFDEPPDVIVEVANAKLRPHWTSNDLLVVEACGATKIEARTRVLRRNAFRPDGSENAVRLDIITAPNTRRNGTAYCAAKDEGHAP